MKEKIIVIAPNPWSFKAFQSRRKEYDFVFIEEGFQNEKLSFIDKLRLIKGISFEKEAQRIAKMAKDISAHAIIGVDEFISCLIATRANEILGNLTLPLKLELSLQHKYYSRMLQQEIVPEYTPKFSVVPKELHFPVFMKPIRGSASLLAKEVRTEAQFKQMYKASFIKNFSY
jgi:hypothetical protein